MFSLASSVPFSSLYVCTYVFLYIRRRKHTESVISFRLWRTIGWIILHNISMQRRRQRRRRLRNCCHSIGSRSNGENGGTRLWEPINTGPLLCPPTPYVVVVTTPQSLTESVLIFFFSSINRHYHHHESDGRGLSD